MFIPGISKRSSSTKRLERRKGGGGGGVGGRGGGGGGRAGGVKGGGSSGGSGSGVSSGSSGVAPRPITSSSGFSFGGKTKSVSAYGAGGGAAVAIPAGAPFAGRLAGGGTRGQIFGTRTYGSGYGTGFTSRGVSGHPFPFYFWPVVWGGAALIAGEAYLDTRSEYGDVNNSTRPGGPLSTAVFRSSSTSSTFHIVADNDTVVSLISDISQNCSTKFSTNPAPTSTPLDIYVTSPRPEQVVQYYRASSIALTLDGYNNSATYSAEGTPDSPLPSGVDMVLLDCLNGTIGLAAPLVDGGMALWTPSYFSLIGLVWALWALIHF